MSNGHTNTELIKRVEKKLDDFCQKQNGMDEKLDKVITETAVNAQKNKSMQNEITEHKKNHWKIVALTFSGAGAIAGIITLIIML